MTATLTAATGIQPLSMTADATSDNVGRLRRAARDWLTQTLQDDLDAAEDLTLAVSEALENAADHAFVDLPTAGTMWLRAGEERGKVVIVVGDNGRWRQPAADAGFRGRGLDLIKSLVDASRVQPTAGGTAVTLVHHRSAAG